MSRPGDNARARSRVATILAVGLSLSVLLLSCGIVYDAITNTGPGLNEHETQILTTIFGGMIGLLGSYLGFISAHDQLESETEWVAQTKGTTMTTTEPPNDGDDDVSPDDIPEHPAAGEGVIVEPEPAPEPDEDEPGEDHTEE